MTRQHIADCSELLPVKLRGVGVTAGPLMQGVAPSGSAVDRSTSCKGLLVERTELLSWCEHL